MKVVILGGYGVFGAKLARLLVRDGHAVVIGGRSADKARAFAAELGAQMLVVDRAGDLAPLWACAPDVVVDAAGPFHAYGAAPYRLAKEAIARSVHYLDLCDDPEFCIGVSALDAAAKTAGVFVLPGLSSVPAISSAAVAALVADALEVDTISTAILPGNRAPRGRSVVASILNQTGIPTPMPADGVATTARGWSQPAMFDLGQGIKRRGWMIGVPDHQLFARAFAARTVLFRAGLELPVMNWSLAALSWLRGKRRFAVPAWFISLLLVAAGWLKPFGTDEGGMSVAVTGRYAQGWQRKTWRLIAKAGEGPFVPAVAARALLRDPAAVAPGARPAVSVVSLEAVEGAMSDLAVSTDVKVEVVTPIFVQVLGDSFVELPATLQQTHEVYGPRRWAGRTKVTRGASLWSRILADLIGFPKASDDIAVTVTMTPQNGGELWERRFDGKPFRSFLRPKQGEMTERFGPLTFSLGLHVRDGQLHFPVKSGRLGPLPLPRVLLPQSVAREYEADGRFHFDVALLAPFTGASMVHYQGWLMREASSLGDGDEQIIERPKATAIVQ
ncbi:SDR family oxidoreductase [Loktanella sp. Alg231-35]|uniref:SDR family oxidoreductase n=1 Tax=Loktanella sp. Alg231-35 TaxID=1922220 RepID=UPI000D555823|nr:SDR family oxidoreductase [Loktanella sp. Alg231-35]